MLSIIIALLVNLLIETSVSLTVVVPGDPIEAHVGSTVILPCWISPSENAEALEIRWYRHDQFNNPVLLYNHEKIQDIQEESYRNRSSLTLRSDQSGGLKDGDVSLRLEKLRVQDDGSFRCYVSGESAYGKEDVVLKIAALGSTPVLVPKPLDDGRVNISCRSSGWYPEPSITWTSDDGRVLRPGGTSHSRRPDEMFFVQSWTAVSRSDTQLVSCSVSIRPGELQESRIDVQPIISSDSSGPWKALFFTFIICALLGLVGFILYKYRDKLTGKKPTDPNREEGTTDKLGNKGMLLIIIALLVNLLIETSVSLTVVVPGDPIVAHVGSTVILPCWISPSENAEALEIRWYRHDQFNNPVLLYNHGKIQDIQEESYRNRSSLTLRSDQSGGLKDGDISLRLEKLRVQDDGSFHCYVSGDTAYDSREVRLKITALGSTPVLVPKPLDDGRVNISCRSSGWYPEPSITWTSDDGRVLRPGGTSHSRRPDEMFSVHSWMAVSRSDAQLVSCSVSLRTGELQESRIDVQAIISSDVSSGPWKALFFTLLIFALLSLGLVGFILCKYRERLTGKKPVSENCEEKTMEQLIKDVGRDENIEDSREHAVVGDINIEELRKHAAEITIDRERLHPDLKVSEDCKIVRDSPDYIHTGEGFPYQLCAFGAQKFTSGRHYWEVELTQENTLPKSYWLIGVVKDGHLTARDRSGLTPFYGFWFLYSDGPDGFYTNTNPPVKLSLTPRPERLGVLLDYDDGQLSFYNVKERKHLLTIKTRFSGSVVPLFNPGAGDLSPLRILACPKSEESAVKSAFTE